MKNKIRIFVAVELPVAVQKEIERVQHILKASALFEGRFANLQQSHITIKFIGDVMLKDIPSIHTALQDVIFSPSKAQLDRIGIFGTDHIIKVVYLNIVSPELAQLALTIDHQLEPWCMLEVREFVSHVTLARVKKVVDKKALLDFIEGITINPIIFTIDKFVLMESVLTPEGPDYKRLYVYEHS
ncbi:MAG TPA: RNA 2',3'-cyclic phosphodiesterase [Candidatus Dependentiae bacterium]|nr:RNA 2',3'-cyclic phosphodiesterase [Candidatus Dependentiae bacterium]HRQ62734.1 RNA 2',3'-cyclic phosphodiesterase [Candidatus Dependentiae bacterium]